MTTFTCRRGSRSLWLAALLIVTLGATGAIGWEARRAAEAEQRMAEGVLTDYASFAASEFARAVSRAVTSAADSALNDVACAADSRGLEAALASAAVTAAPCDCGPRLPRLHSVFTFDAEGPLSFAGTPLPDRLRAIVGGPPVIGRVRVSLIDSPSDTLVTAWRTDARLRTVGLVTSAAALEDVFAWAARERLLPASLLDAETQTAVLGLSVHAGDRVLYAGGAAPSQFRGTTPIDVAGAGLTVAASLAPDAAGSLVIGGLPRSRMPLVYGLLALSAVLVALAFVQMRREAELGRLRTEFVAGVSHELRTPLAQIRMFAETLALDRARSDEERRHGLAVVLRESQRLSILVDRVLSFARADREPGVEWRDIDVTAVLDDVAAGFAPLAAAHGTALRVEATPGLVVRGDRTALTHILVNLIDNAVKYGRHGQVVTISATSSATGVDLVVDDEGPGIAEADRAHVWRAYWRAPGSAEGGSGIGLAIVDRLVRLHGGRAWIGDRPGGGARVSVHLPGGAAAPVDRAA